MKDISEASHTLSSNRTPPAEQRKSWEFAIFFLPRIQHKRCFSRNSGFTYLPNHVPGLENHSAQTEQTYNQSSCVEEPLSISHGVMSAILFRLFLRHNSTYCRQPMKSHSSFSALPVPSTYSHLLPILQEKLLRQEKQASSSVLQLKATLGKHIVICQRCGLTPCHDWCQQANRLLPPT